MSIIETLGYDTWDNALIKESVKRDVNLIIVEELGVSAQVSSSIVHILNKIKDGYVNVQSTPLKDENDRYIDGVGFRDFNFSDRVFGTDLTFFVRIYMFNNEHTYKNVISKYGVKPFTDAKSSFGDNKLPISKRTVTVNMISVSGVCINGRISEDTLMSSLSYELRHVYDQSMWQKSFSSRKDDTLYRKLSGILNSTDYSEKQRLIAFSIYQSFDYEQQALVQEFYDKAIDILNKKGPNVVNDYIKDNEIIDTLMKMKFVRNQLSENLDTINDFREIKGFIGIDIYSAMKLVNNGITSLSKKYGKAVVMLKKEMERDGVNITQLERTNEIGSQYKI